MEDARFFHQQANRCYQLAWQSFDLRAAHKLNLLGNEHIGFVPRKQIGRRETDRTPDEDTGRSKKHQ